MVFVQSEPSGDVPRFKIMTRGRKAWFLFDREMVALGAGISSIRDEPVGTTLNQTALRGPVLIDGRTFEPGELPVSSSSWVLHDEVGYTLLEPAAATVKVAAQTGERRFGRSSDSNVPLNRIGVLVLDRPWGPSARRPICLRRCAGRKCPTACGVEVAPAGAGDREQPPSSRPSSNDSLGVAEIVFYRPGSITLADGVMVKVDHPCLVLLRKQGVSTRVAVSSPGGEVSDVRLTIATAQRESIATFALPSGGHGWKKPGSGTSPVTW